MTAGAAAPVAAVDTARYLSLETRRRDGRAVATPVWFAHLDDAWFVFSAGDAGKVKRLRHTGAVRVAPCDGRGAVHGEWLATHAALVDDDHSCRRAYAALRRRYGWQMRIADFFSRLTGRIVRRQVIRIQRPD